MADTIALDAAQRGRQVYRQTFNCGIAAAIHQLEEAEKAAIYGKFAEAELLALRAARQLLQRRFWSLPVTPDEADFSRLADDLRFLADTVDPVIAAIGEDARVGSSAPIRDFRDCFDRVLFNAIDGNAAHVLDTCAENARHVAADAGEIADRCADERMAMRE